MAMNDPFSKEKLELLLFLLISYILYYTLPYSFRKSRFDKDPVGYILLTISTVSHSYNREISILINLVLTK